MNNNTGHHFHDFFSDLELYYFLKLRWCYLRIYQTRCNYKSSWTLVCLLLFRGTIVLDSGTYPKFDFQVLATIREMGWSTALRTVRKGYASDKNEISARTAPKDSLSLLILYLNKWQAQPFQTVFFSLNELFSTFSSKPHRTSTIGFRVGTRFIPNMEWEWHFLHHFRRGPSRGQGCDFDAPSAIRSPQNHYHLGFAFLGSDPQKWLNFFLLSRPKALLFLTI